MPRMSGQRDVEAGSSMSIEDLSGVVGDAAVKANGPRTTSLPYSVPHLLHSQTSPDAPDMTLDLPETANERLPTEEPPTPEDHDGTKSVTFTEKSDVPEKLCDEKGEMSVTNKEQRHRDLRDEEEWTIAEDGHQDRVSITDEEPSAGVLCDEEELLHVEDALQETDEESVTEEECGNEKSEGASCSHVKATDDHNKQVAASKHKSAKGVKDEEEESSGSDWLWDRDETDQSLFSDVCFADDETEESSASERRQQQQVNKTKVRHPPKHIPQTAAQDDFMSYKEKYVVQEVLSTHGAISVYRAHRKADEVQVIMKIRKKSKFRREKWVFSPIELQMLPEEVALIKNACVLSSDLVNSLLDWQMTLSKLVLVQDVPTFYKDLSTMISQEGVLEEPLARQIFRQVVEAINFFNGHGVFYQELHPWNVLVNGATRHVRLSVFGFRAVYRLTKSIRLTGSQFHPQAEAVKKRKERDFPAMVRMLGEILCFMTYGFLPTPHCGLTRPYFRRGTRNVSEELDFLIYLCLQRKLDFRPSLRTILNASWMRMQ